ncbi:Hypothetical_protein [Hexamita inflata]|uniref:Hypothetical_protein n=1 Tax=Hexamita inflata TaxID=28002 RepID=A0AA86UQH3_9EUKA|nr:Hypothetical protein HINF_LOCUS48241 [Hexamita inflata]
MIPSSCQLDDKVDKVDIGNKIDNYLFINIQQSQIELQDGKFGNLTDILQQCVNELKKKIQLVHEKFLNEREKLKQAYETIKQLSAQPVENNGTEPAFTKCNNISSISFKYESMSENLNELQQLIQNLQKQLELENKKVLNEQFKLKLANESIMIFQREQQQVKNINDSDQIQEQDYQLEIVPINSQEKQLISCNLSQQLNLAFKQVLMEEEYYIENLSEIEICQIVNKISPKEKRQLKFWKRVASLCNQSKNRIIQLYCTRYQKTFYTDQNQKLTSKIQYYNQNKEEQDQLEQQIMSAFQQILIEEKLVKENASDEDQIRLIVKNMPWEEKKRLNFWHRAAEICQVDQVQIQIIYTNLQIKYNKIQQKIKSKDKKVNTKCQRYIKQLKQSQQSNKLQNIQQHQKSRKDQNDYYLQIQQEYDLNKIILAFRTWNSYRTWLCFKQ